MYWSSLVFAGIEFVNNHYLDLDNHRYMYNHQLLGKFIAIEIRPFPMVFFNISDRKMNILGSIEKDPDSTLSTSICTLLKLRDPNHLASLLKVGDIDIKGDLRLMQQFADFFTSLNWQLEERAASLIGDIPSHLLFSQIYLVNQKLQRIRRNTEKQIAVAAQEWQMTVGKQEYDYWSEDIVGLSEELQRLEQRINRLA